MGLTTALAISIGVLGGIATYLSLGPLASFLQIWVIFIAWASFYNSGGKEGGFSRAVVHNIFGAIMGWIAFLLVKYIPLAGPLTLPVWGGICVAVTVFVLVLAATNAIVKDIPTSVVGYAAMAGFTLLKDPSLDKITATSLENPLVVVVISLVVGAVFGYVSEKIAGALSGG